MTKKVIFCCILIINYFTAQQKQIWYELKYRPSVSVDSTVSVNMVLDINGSKSIFREQSERRNDSLYEQTKNLLQISNYDFHDGLHLVKDNKNKIYFKLVTRKSSVFKIEVTEKIIWSILPETKKIADLNCQKAIANYGGREWIAWFTTSINLQEGPYIFDGLPGLIISVEDKQSDFIFSLQAIKNSNGDLFQINKYIPITWQDYKKQKLDYFSDPMRDYNSQFSDAGQPVVFFDEYGKKITPNFKEMNDNMQKDIIRYNNPIELNQKIIYPQKNK